MINILVVDDEINIRQLILVALRKEKYNVITANNGEDAIKIINSSKIDLAIVDVMMPKKNGWELTKEIKENSDIPIIMLTAMSEINDKVKGFELGCDDYIVKPFQILELIARVKAVLKRYQLISKSTVKIGNLKLNFENYSCKLNNRDIELTVKEFQLLFKLASYNGKVFSRDELIEQIWGIDYEGDDRTVDVHIKRIRDKLEAIDDSIKIVTVRGIGYKIEVKDEIKN